MGPPPMPVSRTIASHRKDDAGTRVLGLDCGHERHVRHSPPWSHYPWALDDAACDRKLGESIECAHCGQRRLPDRASVYKRTPSFDAGTVPRGLLRDHDTAKGVWARVVVEVGIVRVHFHAPLDEVALGTPSAPVVVPPQLRHHVVLEAEARFHVEFLR